MSKPLFASSIAVALLMLARTAPAVTVDLVDGQGALTWDTSVSVTSATPNTSVTHPLFPGNRHPHEGWFIYIDTYGVLAEFTSFTKTTDGVSQDVVSSTLTTGIAETFTLDLTYGITATGPDGLPDLAWSGSLTRLSPSSPFDILDVRLFNVFDYDVGLDPSIDAATATQTVSPASTLISIDGSGGVSGQRGVYGSVHYSADTLANVLTQIQVGHALNDTAAAGPYDVAGAFQWDFPLCKDASLPACQGVGNGSGGIGGFGGFAGFATVPEPSILLLGSVLLLAMARPARNVSCQRVGSTS